MKLKIQQGPGTALKITVTVSVVVLILSDAFTSKKGFAINYVIITFMLGIRHDRCDFRAQLAGAAALWLHLRVTTICSS